MIRMTDGVKYAGQQHEGGHAAAGGRRADMPLRGEPVAGIDDDRGRVAEVQAVGALGPAEVVPGGRVGPGSVSTPGPPQPGHG
jgi:hypothetical protein